MSEIRGKKCVEYSHKHNKRVHNKLQMPSSDKSCSSAWNNYKWEPESLLTQYNAKILEIMFGLHTSVQLHLTTKLFSSCSVQIKTHIKCMHVSVHVCVFWQTYIYDIYAFMCVINKEFFFLQVIQCLYLSLHMSKCVWEIGELYILWWLDNGGKHELLTPIFVMLYLGKIT